MLHAPLNAAAATRRSCRRWHSCIPSSRRAPHRSLAHDFSSRLSRLLPQGTSGGVKRDISSSLTRGINAKRLCNRLKAKDGQMCELKYEKKIDPKTTDFSKLRVKELRRICEDEGLDTKGLVEKDEYIKKIKTHFGIKDEV